MPPRRELGTQRRFEDASGGNLIVSASRSVLYASAGPDGYADAARREAEALRDRINAVLAERGLTGARG